MTERIPRATAAVFLDLDGTLLDTAPDLARALNFVLVEDGRAALPLERIRPYVSHGVTGLLHVGYGMSRDDARFNTLRDRVLAAYERKLVCDTRFFPGMDATLSALEGHGIPWGIVTNKIARLTDPIAATLQLDVRAACIISGDSAARSKPWPDPLLLAAKRIGVDPVACIYVGDAERDVQAGRAAGMCTLVALFGYLGPDDDPDSWQADGCLDHPAQLLDWLA